MTIKAEVRANTARVKAREKEIDEEEKEEVSPRNEGA